MAIIVPIWRSCGGCTACCKTHAVLQILKNAGNWCVHCLVGEGCAIYAKRPSDCRGFQCSWLAGKGADEDRPDRTRIVLEARQMGKLGTALWLWEVEPGALVSAFAKRETKQTLRTKTCVMHVPLTGNPRLYLARGVGRPEQSFLISAFDRKLARVEIVPFGS